MPPPYHRGFAANGGYGLGFMGDRQRRFRGKYFRLIGMSLVELHAIRALAQSYPFAWPNRERYTGKEIRRYRGA